MADEPHVHVVSCYRILLNCGRTEHSHSSGCLDMHGLPKCLLNEHSHTNNCNAQVLCCIK